jgi:hypothetical protein
MKQKGELIHVAIDAVLVVAMIATLAAAILPHITK